MRNSTFSTGTYKEGLFHCHLKLLPNIWETSHNQPRGIPTDIFAACENSCSVKVSWNSWGELNSWWTADEQLMNSWWTADEQLMNHGSCSVALFLFEVIHDWLTCYIFQEGSVPIWSFADWILPAFPWFLVPKHSGGGHQQAVHDLGWLRFGKQGSIFWNVEIGLYQNGGIHQFLAIFQGDNDEKSWVGQPIAVITSPNFPAQALPTYVGYETKSGWLLLFHIPSGYSRKISLYNWTGVRMFHITNPCAVHQICVCVCAHDCSCSLYHTWTWQNHRSTR